MNEEHAHMSFWDVILLNSEAHAYCTPADHLKLYLMIFTGLIIALLFLVLMIYNRVKLTRALLRKNELLNEKNSEITQSILYARRIQESLLPKESIIHTKDLDCFIHYSPKDIVSGDLYFLHQTPNYLYAAVVDCTGHGVPGAFLTFIAHQGLSLAIKEKGLTNPSEILHFLNGHVKTILNQNSPDNKVQDSMDAGLVIYHLQEKKAVFCGANLSLQLIHEKEIKEFKGDKVTVGSVQEHVQQPPRNQEFSPSPGSTLYMYSDGVPDQTGGPKGKKLKSSGVRELLQEIASLSIKEQHQLFIDRFSKWQSDYEQTDDVVLLGMKFQ